MIPVEIGARSHKVQGHILKANILYNDVKCGKKLISKTPFGTERSSSSHRGIMVQWREWWSGIREA